MFKDNLSGSTYIDSDTELITLLTKEEEAQLEQTPIPEEMAILPVRNTVLFPGVVMPITAGRTKSITLLQEAYENNATIGVVSQKESHIDSPGMQDIQSIGTTARIIKLLKMPNGNITVIIQGKRRFKIEKFIKETPYFTAQTSSLSDAIPDEADEEFSAMIESIRETAQEIVHSNPSIPQEATLALKNIDSVRFLMNFVSSNLSVSAQQKQKLLAQGDLKKRAIQILKALNVELQRLQVKNDIQSKVRNDLDQQQREYFLHQQMKTIQEELGGSSYEQEVEDFRKKAKRKKWSAKVAKHFDKELQRMQRMNVQAPEYGVQRNYLEFMLQLPWNNYTKDVFDLDKAQNVLDEAHFGLEKVKERVIEHLAVLKLKKNMKSPILCLYGPPGVGKTSLGKSIAQALGRKYVRMSLGGLHDESEIRGHRKTYIGAMSGRILQSIKKVESGNPVFLLDEIDKMTRSAHGDPSSAMLEVLDPEQNVDFYDNFLEIGYDLSKVMFVATANSLSDIQPALLDRMEIIEINGYILEEKIEIAKQHLLPKQILEHGLERDDISMDDAVLEKLISGYTRESGVRALDKKIAQLVRNGAKRKASNKNFKALNYTFEDVEAILGPVPFQADRYEGNQVPGIATGLAWTRVGGDILFIESILSKGKGRLSITGNLGQVMKESATIALQYIKAHHKGLGIDPELFTQYDVHIHVPEGATPKDGPSAGITLLTALVSACTRRKVKAHIAMTGEITLRGRVLPVGGIKEKILAAKRAEIKEIILSTENRKDIEEIAPIYRKGLRFTYVDTMQAVLEASLSKQKAAPLS